MRGEGIYATNIRAIMHHNHRGLEDEVACGYRGDRRTFYLDLYDRRKDTAYEIKSCERDLTSGYGLNFIGKKNYLICPPNLVIKAGNYLDELGLQHVGIIAMSVNEDVCCEEINNPTEYLLVSHVSMLIRECKEVR